MKNTSLLLSAVQLLGTLSLMVVSVFAWFTLRNQAQTGLEVSLPSMDFTYALYVYSDDAYDGSQSLTLIDNICTFQGEQACYQQLVNPSPQGLLNAGRQVFPDDRFSFAIRIENHANESGLISLAIGDVMSTGYDLVLNKVQVAFSYYVTKIVYVTNDLESLDIKDQGFISYCAGSEDNYEHFGHLDGGRYELASHINIGDQNSDDRIIIIFFDLYFDPWVGTVDALGNPIENSNAFQNQDLSISKLMIMFHPES